MFDLVKESSGAESKSSSQDDLNPQSSVQLVHSECLLIGESSNNENNNSFYFSILRAQQREAGRLELVLHTVLQDLLDEGAVLRVDVLNTFKTFE